MEKRVKIIYDGSCFQVNDDNSKESSYIVNHQLGEQVINGEKFKNIRIPKLLYVSTICCDFEKENMFNDLRGEYISTKEELKEFIYKNL